METEEDVVKAMNCRGFVAGTTRHALQYGFQTRTELLAKIRARPDVQAFQAVLLEQMSMGYVGEGLMKRNHAIPLRTKELIEIIRNHPLGYTKANPLRQTPLSIGLYAHPLPEKIEARLEATLEEYFTENPEWHENEWDCDFAIYKRALRLYHELNRLRAFAPLFGCTLADELCGYYLYLSGVVFFCRLSDRNFTYDPMPDRNRDEGIIVERRLNHVWLNFTECFYDRSM
jgi:hypothetical protein